MIPGVPTLHPRSSWEEVGFRMAVDFDKQPPRQRPLEIWQPVIHYSSAINLPDGDVGEFDWQIPPWLRATMRDYMTNRSGGNYRRKSDGRLFPGYPTGYLFAIDWLGGVWEIRGFDYESAANAPSNRWTCPLLMITDRHDPATPAAWASARAIFREFRRRSGRPDFATRPLGHGELPGAATACPGAPILSQLHEGWGDLDRDDMKGVLMDRWTPSQARLLDTRVKPLGSPMAHKQTITVGVPAHAPAVGAKVHVTLVAVQQQCHAVVWPAGQSMPGTSDINASPGQVAVSNTLDVPIDDNGNFNVYVEGTKAGPVAHLIVDLKGLWFA